VLVKPESAGGPKVGVYTYANGYSDIMVMRYVSGTNFLSSSPYATNIQLYLAREALIEGKSYGFGRNLWIGQNSNYSCAIGENLLIDNNSSSCFVCGRFNKLTSNS
jgi:hypothetical protein